MTLTTRNLTAAAGLAAVAAGAIFIGVQINHPPADLAHLVTTDLLIREVAKAAMAVLALVGITGMFLRQHHRFGVLGLAGYLLLSVGYLAMFAVQCIVGFVLPTVAATAPGYAQDVITAAMGNAPAGDIGAMQVLLTVAGIGYALGGLLFGIATFRAGILARWASTLLAIATTSALALAVLPEAFDRPFAVPTGVALIGLGLSLWRDQRAPAASVADQPALVR